MIVQITIKHYENTIIGIEKIEVDEYEGLKNLMTDAVSGLVSYIKLFSIDGNDIFIGRNLLINSSIEIEILDKKDETK